MDDVDLEYKRKRFGCGKLGAPSASFRDRKDKVDCLFFPKIIATMHRNVRKCLSSYELWRLQERWSLETAPQIWSRFLADRSSVDPRLGALVWNGVPSNMREEMYMELSGG